MGKTKLILGGALLVLVAGSGTACHHATTAESTPAVSSSPTPAIAVQATPAEEIPRISVQDAKAAFDKGKAVIIDVRGPDAYKLSHIKGSLEYSLSRLQQGDFKDLPKNKQVIAYCSCPSEHTSGVAAQVLQKAGYKDAMALVGGNMAWETAGYEMVKAPPSTPNPVATVAKP